MSELLHSMTVNVKLDNYIIYTIILHSSWLLLQSVQLYMIITLLSEREIMLLH